MKRLLYYNFLRPFRDLIYTIYPSLCLMCNENQRLKEDIFCFECFSTLPYTDHFQLLENSASDHFVGRIKIENVAALLYFYKLGKVQELLHNLKYNGKQEVGVRCGQLIGERMEASEFFKEIDMMIPLPIHNKKLHLRGYNQSEKIAKGIRDITNIPIVSEVLIKNKNTISQTQLHRHERVENVEDSFEVVDGKRIKNKNILIVDDVITTGATVEVAAQNLIKSGASKISLVTIAIAT